MDLNLMATVWSLMKRGLNLITEMGALVVDVVTTMVDVGGATEAAVATVVAAVATVVVVEVAMVGADVEGVTEGVVDEVARLTGRARSQLVQVNHWFIGTANYLDLQCFCHLIYFHNQNITFKFAGVPFFYGRKEENIR
jgi:hypothetical protein